MQVTDELRHKGFAVMEGIYSSSEIEEIILTIENSHPDNELVRRSEDIFAVRQFFKAIPKAFDLVFNKKLKNFISDNFGLNYFVVKSIYFDKPSSSNWYVSYHQDLTISVDKKDDIAGFGPWTVKQNQYAVQPPLPILDNNFTIRIHLDNTGANNGALRVVDGSHKKGIYRPETIDWNKETELVCSVPKGGIMLMKPLLLHSSSRTTNSQKRRVLHVEFSNTELPEPLHWSERVKFQ